MKLVFISNYLNFHMIPICAALNAHPQVEEFSFIALTEQSRMRKEMGFSDVNKSYSYVCRDYESEEAHERAIRLMKDADVAIIGHAPDEWVALRMRVNKLTFLCSERFYKKGLWRRFVPSSYKKKRQRILQYKEKNLYYLTIGAYMPYDLHLIGFPIEKCFQWAYFPRTYELPKREEREMETKIRILWAGRLIRSKHPEIAIKIAEKLKKRNVDFELSLVGDGFLYQKVEKIIKKKDLSDKVFLLGNCAPDKTQIHMSQSDIFLFTSDYSEGWGAVLNEAMAQGCIPVASYKAGASEILIRHGESGYIYRNYHEAVEQITALAKDSKLRRLLSHAAVKTICDVWSADYAAERFVCTVENIQKKNNILENDYFGKPMSAVILRKAKNFIYTQ